MPRKYPAALRHQVIELARSGTKVAQLAATFGISAATIYNWLKQERIDRGEIAGGAGEVEDGEIKEFLSGRWDTRLVSARKWNCLP